VRLHYQQISTKVETLGFVIPTDLLVGVKDGNGAKALCASTTNRSQPESPPSGHPYYATLRSG
jgi:hypothetical protein